MFEMALCIYGKYNKTLWRDKLDGYTYFLVTVSEAVPERSKWGTIICTGYIPDYEKGIPLCLYGIWEDTDRGKRFKVVRLSEEAEDEYTAIAYLSSGICPGVSQAFAKRIVNALGQKAFEIMASPNGPELVQKACAPLMQKKLAESLCSIVSETRHQRELFEYVSKYGGKWDTAVKLYKEYKDKAKAELKEHPFIGVQYGMSFDQCDHINKNNGHDAADPERIKAAVMCCMDRITKTGHEYVFLETLAQNTEKMLEKTSYKDGRIPAAKIAAHIEDCRELYVERGLYNKVWMRRLKDAEENTVQQIKRLMQTSVPLEYNDSLADYAESLCGMKYAPQQKAAFQLLKKSGVAILTGGPGTGKTTTVNGVINAYEKMYPENIVQLCAPTGRAAQRMAESTGREAITIHRLLEYKPFGDRFSTKNASDPILADLIVADETSMLDIEIASLFFSAVKDGALVLLIGDVDQLPSVGPGNVLHDMIMSERIPVCRLTEIYRQSGQSPIVRNANTINCGDDEILINDDFTVSFCRKEEDMMGEIIKGIQKFYDPNNPFKTQVLVPTHKGRAGVSAINKRLQDMLNPKKPDEQEYHFGQKSYRVNDKIIMLSNNYEAGYFNGDLGIVTKVETNSITVQIMDKEIRLGNELISDVNLAYAMTIHKSQGSEFENVIISLPFNPSTMLKRNLLYTAVTRAKKRVLIVAENGAVAKSVASCDTGKRKTELKYKLQKSLQKG